MQVRKRPHGPRKCFKGTKLARELYPRLDLRSSWTTSHSWGSLQDQARALLAGLARLSSLQQSCTGGSVEDFTDTFIGASRALEVFVSANLLANFLTLYEER